jgi:hypothetical protein
MLHCSCSGQEPKRSYVIQRVSGNPIKLIPIFENGGFQLRATWPDGTSSTRTMIPPGSGSQEGREVESSSQAEDSCIVGSGESCLTTFDGDFRGPYVGRSSWRRVRLPLAGLWSQVSENLRSSPTWMESSGQECQSRSDCEEELGDSAQCVVDLSSGMAKVIKLGKVFSLGLCMPFSVLPKSGRLGGRTLDPQTACACNSTYRCIRRLL